MKFPLLVTLLYFSTAVLAGGYQGCLERVHLFQAYEIDGLMQHGDRILGWGCNPKSWQNKKCQNDDWSECKGSRTDGRCTFDELMHFMEPGNKANTWNAGVYQPNGRIDAEKTAVKCYQRYQARKSPVKNFPPWKAIKGNVHEFNDYIRKVSDRVDFVYRKQIDSSNNDLFKDFDGTRDKINKARAGDHGKHLIDAARKAVGLIYVQDLGKDPTTGEDMETVDWAKTAQNGDKDIRSRIRNFLNGFYSNKAAREHLAVFKSYKYGNDRAVTCGRRGMQHI
ncbi:hypothetical protein EJ04DRAFT_555577 [Polyplosphaeria fusca]|uniref:Uncharacterized protein n=1 Tax=Polyplosphaeria fusca TaxID=682080 RepID=A0A9P4UZG8_9PLEO|nr:hypothetical protein EJ04DRAFT_555577 [Polyplosphaeria fusca]